MIAQTHESLKAFVGLHDRTIRPGEVATVAGRLARDTALAPRHEVAFSTTGCARRTRSNCLKETVEFAEKNEKRAVTY